MAELVALEPRIPAMSADALATVERVEAERALLKQVPLRTNHLIHGGMYARTVLIPAGVMITGVAIKIATILIVQGKALAYIGTPEPLPIDGYLVMPASKGRKQAFMAVKDTFLTMMFPTQAETVEEAERQFTDEVDKLSSRRDADCNDVLITGE